MADDNKRYNDDDKNPRRNGEFRVPPRTWIVWIAIFGGIILLMLFTVITGLVYPAVVTAIAQLVMPGKANGSLIESGGKAVGSALIGQPFSDPKYFWGRPSATTPMPYNAGASSGSSTTRPLCRR